MPEEPMQGFAPDSKHQRLTRYPLSIVAPVQTYGRRLFVLFLCCKGIFCLSVVYILSTSQIQSTRATMVNFPGSLHGGDAAPIAIIVSGETSTDLHGPTLKPLWMPGNPLGRGLVHYGLRCSPVDTGG